MTMQPQKVQYKYGNTMQKVQYTNDNTTAKSTIHIWQYNCKKYNTSMAIQLQKVQYKYDITTAKSTIYV